MSQWKAKWARRLCSWKWELQTLAVGTVSVLGLALVMHGEWDWSAQAQISAPTSQAMEAALGTTTAGAETGIYEIQEAITTGMGVVFAIVLLLVGYRVVIRIIRRVSGA